jgi:hypothetical protein
LRALECLTIVAIGGYFLTSRTQWNASVLPVSVVPGATGEAGTIAAPVRLRCWDAPLVVVHVAPALRGKRDSAVRWGLGSCLLDG